VYSFLLENAVAYQIKLGLVKQMLFVGGFLERVKWASFASIDPNLFRSSPDKTCEQPAHGKSVGAFTSLGHSAKDREDLSWARQVTYLTAVEQKKTRYWIIYKNKYQGRVRIS